ncbi:MAG: hypothetical protein J5585_04620 [Clostridia bacterium]|nr:hypothetical protein [Clostridia bacterium]
MLYEKFYEKTKNRAEAVRKSCTLRTLLLIAGLILVPAAILLVSIFVIRKFNVFTVVACAAAAALFAVDLIRLLRSGGKYLHCRHDAKSVVNEAAPGGQLQTFSDPYDGKVFSYTLKNESSVECGFLRGKYTFKVKNDEWDEVASFTAEREEDFEQAAKEALGYAASLEKLPDGEYDETLQPEVEIDEYEEDPDFGEEEDGEEKEED